MNLIIEKGYDEKEFYKMARKAMIENKIYFDEFFDNVFQHGMSLEEASRTKGRVRKPIKNKYKSKPKKRKEKVVIDPKVARIEKQINFFASNGLPIPRKYKNYIIQNEKYHHLLKEIAI